MVYCPQKEKKAQRLSFISVLSGLLLMGVSSFLEYKVIFQFVSAALVVTGIQLLVRFVLSDFRYIIDDRDDGSAELIIYKKQGRRDELVCRISLSSVTELYEYGAKKSNANSRYNYTQNLFAKGYSLIFADGDKNTEIIIEPDTSFINAINERIGVGEGDFGFMM